MVGASSSVALLGIVKYLILESVLGFNWLGVLVFGIAAVAIRWYGSMPRNRPPGPLGLPIVGSLPFLRKDIHNVFAELGNKFGHLFSLYIGSRFIVVLNDWESIKAAFVNQAENFSGRPEDGPGCASPRSVFNLVVTDGPVWKEHRRFAVHTLREYGFGKNSSEHSMTDEISHFMKELEKFSKNGRAVNITNAMAASVANNVCIMSVGKRFHYEDATFLKLKNLVDETLNNMCNISPTLFFPWLKVIPGIKNFTNEHKVAETQNQFLDVCEKMVSDHEKSHQPGQQDDYIHSYLSEQQYRKQKQPRDNTFSREALIDNTGTFFQAGMETSTTTLRWALVYLMLHPDIQEKLQKEIDTVIGNDRTPSFDDRFRTPYVEAFLNEVLRCGSIVPLNVVHSNFEEAKLLGWTIPQRSYVISNIWYVHHDAKLWGDPNVFRPERFITAEGTVHRPEYLIPFSCGKRVCLGENFARMELYLYLTTMLQKFKFVAPPGEEISDEAVFGITCSPKCNSTLVVSRLID